MRFPTVPALILFWVSLGAEQSGLAGTIEGRIRGNNAGTELSNFVVSVEGLDGAFTSPKEPAVINQKDLRFVPHVLAIQAGTTVEFPNSDPLSHNVFSISKTQRFNLGLYPRGGKRTIRFDEPGIVELLCNVHMEMAGYIVVVKTPYFAKTGPDGSYRIANVPAGQLRLRCWHEGIPTQERVVQVPQMGSTTVDFLIGK